MTAAQRLAWKRRATRVFRLMPRQPRRRVILSYHAVGSGPWSTQERNFREHVAWLVDNARLRPLGELLEGVPTDDDLQVALTFDDGYESVLTKAAARLEPVAAQPTLFVSTSRIGDSTRKESDGSCGYYPDERFLLWGEVLELRARGWRIESHGHCHPDLTQQPADCVRLEMRRSKEILEDRLGALCSAFAYPYGRSNPTVRAVARDCGYRWAFGSIHGTYSETANRYAVPRIDIRQNYELADFVSVVTGDWDYLRLLQTARHCFRFFS
jgi:peptidoglycan/xylan/chitin deacetylase (PgdA/CDA1 family)